MLNRGACLARVVGSDQGPATSEIDSIPLRGRCSLPINGGGVSGLACRSPEPARPTREDAADMLCGSGSEAASVRAPATQRIRASAFPDPIQGLFRDLQQELRIAIPG